MTGDIEDFEKEKFKRTHPSTVLSGSHHQHTAHYWCRHRLREMREFDIGLEETCGVTLYGVQNRVSAALSSFMSFDIRHGTSVHEFWQRSCGAGPYHLSPARNDNARHGWIGRWLNEHYWQFPPDKLPEWFRPER